VAKKFVYFFGAGKAEGNARMRDILGGKGANLAEMTNLGIPVPPGFTISTAACIYYYKNNKKYPQGLKEQIQKNLKRLEAVMEKNFGDKRNPLLVSVRSGAAISMPGMMDTVLNLGLNEITVQGLIEKSSNPRFVYDAYRRFIQMFGDVVLESEHSDFERILEEKKKERGVKLDTELSAEDLKDIVLRYKKLIKEKKGIDFPDEPTRQLKMAIDSVFESWDNPRAITYRNLHHIPHDLGTAVNVQAMVFGNLGQDSGTGVAFTRNPATGEKKFYGEYLMNAQGEDVVAGIRTPLSIDHLEKDNSKSYNQLVSIYKRLEKHYRDMQDLEFTIEEGKLYLLQTRTGKRTAHAAVKIAVEMVKEGLISKKEAILRIEPAQLDQLLHPTIDPKEKLNVIAKGLPASPGAAVGRVVFNSHKAMERGEKGERVVLVRKETSPEDVGGMAASQGILTAVGGLTSHAAIVGRGMGKPCIVGCNDITIHEEEGNFNVGGLVVKEGELLSLNGSTGEVVLGEVRLVEPSLTGDFKTIMDWADETRQLGVRTNADLPHDARVARDFGAEGIGLCRTEHMFFAKDRLPIVREMILAKDKQARQRALTKLLPMQKGDFKEIFKVMKGLPVTIRLLDPPLHEFLPQNDEEIGKVAGQIGVSKAELKDKVAGLHEVNPMLGHRGCRLGITYPEISQMQVQAIFEAACELAKEGQKIIPEVMVPLVGHINEFRLQKNLTVKTAEEVMKRYAVKLKYLVGTMIEVPRASITADEIALEAEFFSFGTNDLTQMTLGFSRDDAGKFLPFYIKEGIFERDPFATIDLTGVGSLIEMGVKKGRGVRPELKIGICGEHGGDPVSIEFCHKVGLDYVSCSPYRVPVARLAAAQAALKGKVKLALKGE
jgi:pyruvate,orthophosphate dikinase